MFRRIVSSTSAALSKPSTSLVVAPSVQHRQLTSCSIIFSAISFYLCLLFGGSWFNNFANVRRYGLWRFRNQLDDNILVSDFKGARYLGCCFGALFYFTLVAPRKYNRKNSSLEQHPGWVRYGPL
eukprot:GDKJ01014972.1.p1 GENE.GDKJ01014972.1~~GDKJ01014972.1.p1  ORF type:complete len:125 (-),score=3.61 GDKJ01014972.1:127-501(-)